MLAILGKKLGMTQFINKAGALIPATALEAGPCVVTEIKTNEKHGYRAAQLGFGDVKEKHLTKALTVNFQKKKLPLKRWLKEVRLTPQENYEIGQEIKADVFKAGDIVDVQGTSIGKGFAGGMKRWHWHGSPRTHGHQTHRRIGSIGASSDPSRTWPGQRMAGRLGNTQKTIQNLEVLKVDITRNLILVKGSVPGSDKGLLFIRRSLKRPLGVPVKSEVKVSTKKKDPLKASKQATAGGGKKK
ncbi:MAG: 50S ribosomal protein L3 [Candidatus Omnitrophica bacterium CG1_02_46_14]|nr:MAG: 50S ribosomal protein L3 [Candidatus Omnitrophica bacterium CG1_02_46_14]